MIEKYYYIYILFFSFLIPFLASFYKPAPYYKEWPFIIPSILIVASLFIFWDIKFTMHGVWGFNPKYTVGINFFGLPLEEILFFFIIPYCSVFVYFCVPYLFKQNFFSQKIQKTFDFVLLVACIICMIIHYDKLYTFWTSLLLFVLLSIKILLLIKIPWFYFSFIFILFFFFITNGILTGTGLNEPIVWYNNNENLNIRIGTIPLEDIFYGMILIEANIIIYEYLKINLINKVNT